MPQAAFGNAKHLSSAHLHAFGAPQSFHNPVALDLFQPGTFRLEPKSVIAEGGRIYLAKDALTRPDHFRAMEPRLDRFLDIRRTWDPEGRVRSAQSVRLFGW